MSNPEAPERTDTKEQQMIPKDQAAIITTADGSLNLIMPSDLVQFKPEMVMLAAIFQRLHKERGFGRYCIDYFVNHPEEAALFGIVAERSEEDEQWVLEDEEPVQ